MEKFINSLTKNSKFLTILFMLIAGTITLIGMFSSFPDSFFPVLAHTILIAITMFLIIGGPICLLLNKEKAGKIIILIFVVTQLLACIKSNISLGYGLIQGVGGKIIFRSIVGFTLGILLFTSVLFYVIYRLDNNRTNLMVSNVMALVSLCFYLLLFIASIILYAQLNLEWGEWLSIINECIFIPLSLFFGYLFLTNKVE